MRLPARLLVTFALAVLGTFALSSCGGGTGLPYRATTSSAANTVTGPVLASGDSINLAPLGGYSGQITFSASNAPNATMATLTSILGQPQGAAQPSSVRRIKSSSSSTVLFSVELSLTATVTFNAVPSFSITLPNSVSTSGQTFFIALFDGTSSSANELATIGPATASGQTLTFAGPVQTTTLNASQTYLFELYETGSSAPAAGTIYVVNAGNQIQAFAAGSASGATAINAFTSSTLVHPTGIAVDATGRVYVAQPPNVYSYTYGSYNGTSSATPSTTLTSVAGPWGLIIDASGDLVATDSSNNAVDFFSPGASGATAPLKSVSGSNTQLSTPYQAAFDSNGNLYVLNAGNSSVTVYAAASLAGSGALNLTPSAVITSTPSAIDHPVALAVDSTGRIYVGNSANTTISVFTYANGFQTPLATLAGGSGGTLQFGCICEATLAVDGSNNFYVAGETDPDVLIFSPVMSSSATPTTTITSSSFTDVQAISVVP